METLVHVVSSHVLAVKNVMDSSQHVLLTLKENTPEKEDSYDTLLLYVQKVENNLLPILSGHLTACHKLEVYT